VSEAKVQRTIARFMTSFDSKDWVTMRAQLADAVHADYSDLRGTPAQTVAADAFVAARIEALSAVKTQHLISNFDVDVAGESAEVRASCVIFRADGARRFTSHAMYRFGLAREGSDWKIASIVQSILWNEGDPQLHSGVPR
jgi:hypothetical protein